MSRNEQMIRFLRMIRLLERGAKGYTLTEIAEHFAVSVKTIRRDLAAMKTASINVIEEEKAGTKVYRIVDMYQNFPELQTCDADAVSEL